MATRRRDFLAMTTASAAAVATAMCRAQPLLAAEPAAGGQPAPANKSAEADVSAPEDLLREHALLDRMLLIYEEGVRRLQQEARGDKSQPVTPECFRKTATLIRAFVEDYHEKLEEQFVFPVFEKHHELVDLVRELKKQHDLGRTLTDAILHHAADHEFADPKARENLENACRAYVRMYRPHMDREGSVLFVAMHRLVTGKEIDALGDQFEDEEQRRFGKEGFERMVEQVAGIERQMGIHDLACFEPDATCTYR